MLHALKIFSSSHSRVNEPLVNPFPSHSTPLIDRICLQLLPCYKLPFCKQMQLDKSIMIVCHSNVAPRSSLGAVAKWFLSCNE